MNRVMASNVVDFLFTSYKLLFLHYPEQKAENDVMNTNGLD